MANTVQQVRILLLLEILLTVQTSAVPLMQIELQELANSLEIRVKVVDNLRHDGQNHIVQTFIKNSGHSPIPDSGWTLYFHSMLPVFPDILLQKGNKTVDLHVEKVRFGLVQGDLFYMEPIEGFVPLKAGEERKYNVIVNLWAVSRTDFMPLWYVVSEDKSVQPYIVHSTSSFDLGYVRPFKDVRQWKRQRGDQYNPYTPEDRLARLKFTDTGKTKLIIPTPKNTRIDDTVKLSSVDTSWGILVDEIYFNETALFLKELYDFNFISNGSSNSIVLSRNNTFSKQGYSVIVSPEQDRIFLQSNTSHGMFYAIQSLRAILEEYNSTNIPSIVIEDEPRFEWRGMHLDVARNFHSVGDVKRLIQAMSMYKMNALHLHLTDDEGWRLEIDGLPELTDVGGKRCHDLNETRCVIPQFGSGPFANTSGSGYYTKNDYRDILRFANTHFVTVIPEFDMPGHSHAAIVSMEQRYRKYIEAGNQTAAEEFRIIDPDDTTFYTSNQNWRDDVINPCIESTYALIGKVMEKVNALHEDVQPLRFYHFGGDEVPQEVWSKSPKCEELLHQNSALNVTHGLKNYFAKRIAALAAVKNMSLGGWEDGFTDGQPRPAPIHTDQMSGVELYVHPWNNIWEWGGGSNAYEYANAGYKVILAPATHLYFGHPQEPGPEERGLYWATRFTDTKKVFKFMPDAFYENIFEDRSGNPLSKEDICGEYFSKCTQLEKPENIIGIQGALWSETVRTSGNMDFMIFPRLLALAERSWYKAEFESIPQNEELFEDEWNAFANAVGSREFRRLDEMDIAFRIPPPGGRALRDGSVQVTTTYPGLDVELSEDNGRSWQIVQQDLINDKVSNPNTAQNMVDYIAEHLAVHLEVISNLIKDPQRYITLKVDFTNNGSDEVANGNWKIYFYR
ncbi:beta-hexosaminidase-like [Mya arenaria]|uniref:beta-hexosaminidase-like n=1 Tax=Mya arenaria TaxID=6604 RepID=UPI0022E3DD38|nr:beta-hexosaminidase-like [Mya arenaria]